MTKTIAKFWNGNLEPIKYFVNKLFATDSVSEQKLSLKH